MNLHLTPGDRGKTIRFGGEHLIQSEAAAVRAFLSSHLVDGDDVVFDLSTVVFMDSSGLGALVSGLKKVGATGSVTIAAPHRAVRKLLSLTRMDSVFRVVDRLDDAPTADPGP